MKIYFCPPKEATASTKLFSSPLWKRAISCSPLLRESKIRVVLHSLERQPFPGIEIVWRVQREVSRDGAASWGFHVILHNLNVWKRLSLGWKDAESTRARVKIVSRHMKHRRERHSSARQRKKKNEGLSFLLFHRVSPVLADGESHTRSRISWALMRD